MKRSLGFIAVFGLACISSSALAENLKLLHSEIFQETIDSDINQIQPFSATASHIVVCDRKMFFIDKQNPHRWTEWSINYAGFDAKVFTSVEQTGKVYTGEEKFNPSLGGFNFDYRKFTYNTVSGNLDLMYRTNPIQLFTIKDLPDHCANYSKTKFDEVIAQYSVLQTIKSYTDSDDNRLLVDDRTGNIGWLESVDQEQMRGKFHSILNLATLAVPTESLDISIPSDRNPFFTIGNEAVGSLNKGDLPDIKEALQNKEFTRLACINKFYRGESRFFPARISLKPMPSLDGVSQAAILTWKTIPGDLTSEKALAIYQTLGSAETLDREPSGEIPKPVSFLTAEAAAGALHLPRPLFIFSPTAEINMICFISN